MYASVYVPVCVHHSTKKPQVVAFASAAGGQINSRLSNSLFSLSICHSRNLTCQCTDTGINLANLTAGVTRQIPHALHPQ